MRRPSLGSALAVTLAACAGSSTHMREVQVAPQPPAQRPTKVLVIGLTGKPDVRSAFEGDMASRLTSIGIQAVQGAAVIPPGSPVDAETLREVVRREGADGVVIARLVGMREQQVVTPAPAAPVGVYGYYGGWATTAYQPTYLSTERVVTVETRLYRTAGDGQLVWRGVSDTIDPAAAADVIRGVNEQAVERMRKDGVL